MSRRVVSCMLSLMMVVACAVAAVPGAQAATDEQTLSVDESTAVVSDTSGYHFKATITNNGDTPWSEGNLALYLNAMYTFTSRTDMQEWAQEENAIPATDELGSAHVPAIAAGQSATVTIDAPADNAALKRISSWGPKPLLAAYTHDDETVHLRSFLTRSRDGLDNAATPAMQITMVMPLASSHWQANNETLDSLVKGKTATRNQNEQTDERDDNAVTLDADHTRLDRTFSDTLSKHSQLQTVADPTYLNALAVPPQVTAVMQPAAFDITAYAAGGDAQSYTDAGLAATAWNSDAALAQYRKALGDDKATTATIAWQGEGRWTSKALAEARRQGYTTVISTYDFESSDTGTVHTGTNVVSTEAGDVTVLVEQRELSNLAKGKATDEHAQAESTEAGRLARFVAQSAFYQMEQPYTQRNLLVCFDTNANAITIDRFMSAVEASSWLEITDLNTLAATTPYATGEQAQANIPQETGLSDKQTKAVADALSTLSAARASIIRFRDSIISNDDKQSDDAQALARQDANKTSEYPRDAWIEQMLNVHDTLALHAMAGNDADGAIASAMLAGANHLSSTLLNGIALTPSETVTMLSETASMPVTVSNGTPYPVEVCVSSISDSPEIATSRRTTVTVPAHAEAQVTFSLRAATSGKATATITLEDHDGNQFGQPQKTTINCVLKISDMTGFAIVAIAVAFGLLGLWRQFHRKKDPDE
ncbi:DUF6049 family protein [Bifidobacterium panos]|uniref:Secreted protein n=1 Tax=Bifidobacterium panos TaxID=2675321 RepID=A0ABX1SY04_9BIFI|nr:DUF6049 family protein [Bifidobacterium sp. DSM 109963]NMN02715.1 hypothetical protein [Bifidobacterium sp. DSM 109963]